MKFFDNTTQEQVKSQYYSNTIEKDNITFFKDNFTRLNAYSNQFNNFIPYNEYLTKVGANRTLTLKEKILGGIKTIKNMAFNNHPKNFDKVRAIMIGVEEHNNNFEFVLNEYDRVLEKSVAIAKHSYLEEQERTLIKNYIDYLEHLHTVCNPKYSKLAQNILYEIISQFDYCLRSMVERWDSVEILETEFYELKGKVDFYINKERYELYIGALKHARYYTFKARFVRWLMFSGIYMVGFGLAKLMLLTFYYANQPYRLSSILVKVYMFLGIVKH